MRKLRLIRIALAVFFLCAATACFLDPTGLSAKWLGWTVKMQFLPALLALSAAAAGVVVVTLVFGRVYCSVVCPLGIMQDVVIFLRRRVAGRAAPQPSGRRAAFDAARWLIAVVFVVGGFVGLHFAWLEPYGIYGRAVACAAHLLRPGETAPLSAWLTVFSVAFLAAVLVLAAFKGRFWCNTVCPVGTALGAMAAATKRGPKVDAAKCVKCRLCEKACKAGCIDIGGGGKIDRARCVACFDCGAACGKGAISWSL